MDYDKALEVIANDILADDGLEKEAAAGKAARVAKALKGAPGRAFQKATGMNPWTFKKGVLGRWASKSRIPVVPKEDMRKARMIAGGAAAGAGVAGTGATYAVKKRRQQKEAAEAIVEASMMKEAAMEVLAEAEAYEGAALEVLADTGYFDDMVDDANDIDDVDAFVESLDDDEVDALAEELGIE